LLGSNREVQGGREFSSAVFLSAITVRAAKMVGITDSEQTGHREIPDQQSFVANK
jgi:hypothetical protein